MLITFCQLLQHLFVCELLDDIISVMRQMAATYLGISIPVAKEGITLEQFMLTRLGLCRSALSDL